jgi:hypothetical protein
MHRLVDWLNDAAEDWAEKGFQGTPLVARQIGAYLVAAELGGDDGVSVPKLTVWTYSQAAGWYDRASKLAADRQDLTQWEVLCETRVEPT